MPQQSSFLSPEALALIERLSPRVQRALRRPLTDEEWRLIFGPPRPPVAPPPPPAPAPWGGVRRLVRGLTARLLAAGAGRRR